MLHLNQFGVFLRAARDVAIPSSFHKIQWTSFGTM